MTKQLLHSLVIIGLTFCCGRPVMLTAQSAAVDGAGAMQNPLGLGFPMQNQPAPRQSARSVPDDVARGMAKQKTYNFRSVDYPGGRFTYVYDFNGKTAVGFTYPPYSAFTFHGTSYQFLKVPDAQISGAFGINASGDIVGRYQDSAGQWHGFLYDGNHYTVIDFPGSGAGTILYDINDAGQIVGNFYDSANVAHGFLYDRGTFTAIDFPGADYTFASGINSSGDIVGAYSLAGGSNGFLLKNGSYSSISVPQQTYTVAYGINDAGVIAGSYYFDNLPNTAQGFTYAGGVFTLVDVPGASSTTIFRISNRGNLIGTLGDSLDEEVHGFIGK